MQNYSVLTWGVKYPSQKSRWLINFHDCNIINHYVGYGISSIKIQSKRQAQIYPCFELLQRDWTTLGQMKSKRLVTESGHNHPSIKSNENSGIGYRTIPETANSQKPYGCPGWQHDWSNCSRNSKSVHQESLVACKRTPLAVFCILKLWLLHQGKFIREARPNSDKLHEQFKTWLDKSPTSSMDLDQIVTEDQLIDYEKDDPFFCKLKSSELFVSFHIHHASYIIHVQCTCDWWNFISQK